MNMEVVSNAMRLQSELIECFATPIQMLLGTERELPSLGGTRFRNVTPNEFIIYAYLNPRFCAAIDGCYGYSEQVIISEMARLYELLFGVADETSQQEAEENLTISRDNVLITNTDIWASHHATAAKRMIRIPSNTRTSIRKELSEYKTSVYSRKFDDKESRKFWCNAEMNQILPKLRRLAMLFMTLPASAVPQERQFSELK